MSPEHESTASNLQMARSYLLAVEGGASCDALRQFFGPGVVQEEFPNRVFAQGAKRDLGAILAAAERGQRVMAKQRYEIRTEMADENKVALEVSWEATLDIPFGTLPAGGTIRAHLAIFLEFRGGKIVWQRNCDCYEPW